MTSEFAPIFNVRFLPELNTSSECNIRIANDAGRMVSGLAQRMLFVR